MKNLKLKNFFIVSVLLSINLFVSCIHDAHEGIQAKKPTLQSLKILGENAMSGSVTIRAKEIFLEKSDIVIEFAEKDFADDFSCSESFPIKLVEGVKKEITITTSVTDAYLPFQKTVVIDCNSRSTLNLKKLSIFGQVASSTFYIPKNKDKIEKSDITLEFIQNDAPTFDIMPTPFKMEAEENEKKLIIFVEETQLYEKWQIEIDVLREKPNTENKTIDDAVLKLKSIITWSNTTIEKDISLPTTIEGYTGSTVEYSSSNPLHCTNEGHISQDLKDISIIFTTTVRWNGKEKTIYFNVTIGRIKKIVKIEPTMPVETKVIYDFSSLHHLDLYQNDVIIKKYQIKSIDIEDKKLTLKLTHKMNEEGELVKLEDLKDSSQKYELIKSLFGDKFVKLKNANEITWENFKEYANDYLNIIGFGSIEDEELFDWLIRGVFFQGIPLTFAGTFEDFKKLELQEMTRILKDLFRKQKDKLIKFEGWNENLTDEELLPSLIEEYKTMFEYKIYSLGKSKVYSYVLKQTNDSTMWNSFYSFETEAIYQKTEAWQEQNGFYILKNVPSNVRLYIEVIYKNKANLYHGTVTYNSSTMTNPSPRYQFSGLLLDAGFCLLDEGYGKELEGNIKDLKNGKISLYISTYGIRSGTNILTFIGEIVR